MVQMHENDRVEQFTLQAIKAIPPPQFYLDKVSTTDSLLDTWATLISVASLTYSHKANGSKR